MDRESFKKEVMRFYNRNKSRGKAFTVRHFEKQGEKESSVLYIIKQAELNPPQRGRRTPFADASNTPTTSGRVVKRTPTNKPSATTLAQLEGYSNKGEKMLETCRERCDQCLSGSNFRDYDWVLENRAGFSLMNNQGSHTQQYYISFPGMRPPPPISRSNYIPVLDVWIAFSNKGISEPFIQPIKAKFDANTYLEECVKTKLVPFITENHDLEKTVLWSDGSGVYTNKKVLAHLESENIEYVDKDLNPGNRVKCFTYFWNLLRNNVYNDGWRAQNEQELENRIRHCLKHMNLDTVKQIANDTPHRLSEMALTGQIKEWSDNKQKYTEKYNQNI